MQTRFVCVWATVVVSCAVAHLPPFAVLPDVPKFVEDNAPHADLNEFVQLWKQTLLNDGQGDAPTVRINFEPKTIVAPNDFQMRNIVPQHVSNPLLDLNVSNADLRREFLLDHILLDPVQLDDPALNTEQGLRMMTFSGKDLIFRFDDKLGLVADGVAVTSAMSLQDATRMLTTDGVLFDAKLRVNNVAQGGTVTKRASDLDSPLGPPLELGIETPIQVKAQPPAPLTPEQLAEIATTLPSRHISPPSLPPGAIVHPPAAPPASRLDRIGASSAGPPAAAGKSLLSTAEATESQLLPVEHRTLDSDQGTLLPASPQVGVPLPNLASPQLGVTPSGLASSPQEEGPGSFDGSPSVGVPLPGLASPSLSQPGPLSVSPSVGVPLPGADPFPAITGNDLTFGTAAIETHLEQHDDLLENLEEHLESIVDIMQEQDLGASVQMLQDTGLLDQLLDDDSGTFLLLSPSNEALARLSADELQELKESQQFGYHIIPLGDMPAPEVTNDSTFTTLLGQPVRFNVYGGKVFVNGAGLLRGDIKVPRGTIQVVDGVLRPPYGDLQTVLQRVDAPVGRTATLVAMHGRSLHRNEPVTVFAPLDASITSKGFSWPDLLENSEMASGLLGGHTVSGSWYTEGLVRQRSLMTTTGVNITFRNMGDGTITANGIPLLVSDLSATDGVVHVVADLIPNADLGTDPNQVRTPLFDLIKDGGIKSSQSHFNGLQFSFGSQGAATVKSVHDSSSQLRSNQDVGVPLSTNSGNVPHLSALYQTPIQESFNFNQVLTQSTHETPGQSPAGTQYEGYDIASPDVRLTPSSDSRIESDEADGVYEQVGPSDQNEGSIISQDNTTFPNVVQLNASGDATFGIQDQLESFGTQEGLDLSLNSQNVNTFQDNTPFDITAADANFGIQNQGLIAEQQEGDGPITSDQDTNNFKSESSFGVTGGIDYDVQEPLVPIDQQDVFTSLDTDLGTIDYQLSNADERSESDSLASGGYGVSTQNNGGYGNSPSVTTTIDQIALNVGAPEPAVLPTLDHTRPIVELSDQPSDFVATGTIISAAAPAPQVPTVPSFLTLYNAPNLSPAERKDPFTEVAAPQLAGKQFLNNRVDTLAVPDKPTQKALLGASADANSLTENVNFISIPKPTPGVTNPFDLTDFSNFASFKTETNETTEGGFSNQTNDHDSFFVITKGDLNLQDIISTLDENIKKDIKILESPSIFFNSSVAELALHNPLPENLLSQIRNSISSNIMNHSVNEDETHTSINQGQPQIELRNESLSPQGRTIEDIFDDIPVFPAFNLAENISLDDENEATLPTTTTTTFIPETTETLEIFDYDDFTVTTIIPIQSASDNLGLTQSFPQINKEFMSGPSHEGQSLTTPQVVQRNRPHLRRTSLIRSSPIQQQRKSVQLPTETTVEGSSLREARNQTRQSTRQRQRTTARMQVQQHFEQVKLDLETQSRTEINQLSNNQLQNSSLLQLNPNLPSNVTHAFNQTEDKVVSNLNQQLSNLTQTVSVFPGTLQIQQDERLVSLPFRATDDDTKADLALAVNQTSNFTTEGKLLQSSRQKSLQPISGLFNLLELQDQEKQIRDQTFPIVVVPSTVTESSIDIIGSSTSAAEQLEPLIEQSTLPVDTDDEPPNQVAPQVQGLVSDPTAAIQLDLLEGDSEVSSSLEEERNVIEFLRSQNLTAFAEMVQITGLNRDMIRGGPWTIFAPSNEGVEIVRMSGGLDLSLKDLRHLTAYHVVPGVLTSDRFRENARLPTLYAGYSIYMKTSEIGQWSVGGGLVTGFSTTHPGSSTWVVHEVDRVLYAPHGNLLTTISLAPALTRFTELLTGDPETQQILQGREPVTVFAPSNTAMGRIRPDVRPSSAWLMSHIVEGFHYSVCFPRNSILTSLAATSVATATNDTNGVVSINGVPASYLDITASNGVLHVLDDLVVFS